VTSHRMHHQFSDQRQDPHSPLVSFFWAHMGWMLYQNDSVDTVDAYVKYCPDLLTDRFYKRLERGYRWLWIYLAHALLFFAIGLAVEWIHTGSLARGAQFGASLVLWGVVIRTIYTWHVTWAVNSAAHRWGYRSHATNDASRNNWLVALATNGEGWHNNHHADQRSAAHGLAWWELDVTYLTIRLLERLGLADKVRHPRGASQLGAKAAGSTE
jgi:fatty-acid desaturase